MSKQAPEYIRVAGVLYKKLPEGTPRTAQNLQQQLLQFQNAAEGLSGKLAKLEQALPLVQKKMGELKAPLENANKAVMGKNFPQALNILTALKPAVAQFKPGIVDVVQPLLNDLVAQLSPATIDSLIEHVNTVSALASAEGAGFGIPGAQPAAQPAAPAPAAPAAPAPSPAPA